jgi:hypothetical protein
LIFPPRIRKDGQSFFDVALPRRGNRMKSR